MFERAYSALWPDLPISSFLVYWEKVYEQVIKLSFLNINSVKLNLVTTMDYLKI